MRHEWVAVVPYDVTPEDAFRMVYGEDVRPIELIASDQSPAADDERPFLGLHNIRQEDVAIACMVCERPFTRELMETECTGEPPLEVNLGAIPVRNLAGGLGGIGRNDPCPCGSKKKFKHCHGSWV